MLFTKGPSCFPLVFFNQCNSHKYRETQNKKIWKMPGLQSLYFLNLTKGIYFFSTAKISEKRSDHRIIWKKPLASRSEPQWTSGKSTGTPGNRCAMLRNLQPRHTRTSRRRGCDRGIPSHRKFDPQGWQEAAKSWCNIHQPHPTSDS